MTGTPVPRYLIRCRSGRHQVAIDPSRFWNEARCPVCRTVVDRFRLRRLWRWSTGRAPRSRVRVGRLGEFTPLDAVALALVLALGAVAIGFRVLGDRWWPVTALLFLGRWPWLVPVVPVAVLALAARRVRTIALAAVAFAIGLFWIMGLSLGIRRWPAPDASVPRVRIVTFNIAGLPEVAARLPALLAAANVDVLAIQECPPDLSPDPFKPDGFVVHQSLGTCLVSRWPIAAVDDQPAETVREAGGSGMVTRYRIESPGGAFDVTNVHLDTPRRGFEALMRGNVGGPDLIRRGTLLREIESRRARRWVDAGGAPRLVAGDFNTPGESVIFQTYWGDLTEAFDHAGVGFGFTRDNGWIKIRIDHILSGPGFQVVGAEVLPDYGSDHLPLLAEVALLRRAK